MGSARPAQMADAGVPARPALRVALCVDEYVIGHAMARSAGLTASRAGLAKS